MEPLTVAWGVVGVFVFALNYFWVSDLSLWRARAYVVLYLWPTWHVFVVHDAHGGAFHAFWLAALSAVALVASAFFERLNSLWAAFAVVAVLYNLWGFHQYNVNVVWRALAYAAALLLALALAVAMRREGEEKEVHGKSMLLLTFLTNLGAAQAIRLWRHDDPDRWNDVPSEWIWAPALALLLPYAFLAGHYDLKREGLLRYYGSCCRGRPGGYAAVE